MEKQRIVKGFCPVIEKELSYKVTYVYNFDCWEKGISEPPCSSPCSDGCPIILAAPSELKSL